MEKKYYVGVLGTGKVAKAIAAGYTKNNVKTLVVKPRLNFGPGNIEAFAPFKKMGCSTSNDYADLKKAEVVIIAVTPDGVGTVLKNLQNVVFEKTQQFILCVSGWHIQDIRLFLACFTHTNIGSITLNTNVAFGEGVICFAHAHGPCVESILEKYLEPLGTIKHVYEKDLLKFVTIVGAGNAFDIETVSIVQTATAPGYPLLLWLEQLIKVLNGEKVDWKKDFSVRFLLALKGNCNPLLKNSHWKDAYTLISQYIETKKRVFSQYFGLSEEDATWYAREAFLSTIRALIARKVNSKDDLELHRATVVTKGGCTEKAIFDFKSTLQLTNLTELASLLMRVYRFSKRQFVKRIKSSIKQAEVTPVRKTQFLK